MLSVKGLTHAIGKRSVLKDVSFSARPGRITGVVGGRGAGKSLLAHIVMGLVDPDEGKVTIEGQELEGGDRQNFGYLPAERGQYPSMRVLDQIVYLARLHGMSLGAAERNAVTLLSRLDISDRAYARLGQLSASEVARVEIATILAADPDVVVIDEPFEGLDAASATLVFDLLRDHADSGVPVLFFSRNWDLADAAADDVVVLDHGKVTGKGSLDKLKKDKSRFRVTLASSEQADAVAELLPGKPKADGTHVEFEAASPAAAFTAAQQATAQVRGTIVDYGPSLPSLAAMYREAV